MAGSVQARMKTRSTPVDVQIGRNVRKYRLKKKWTEANLADGIGVTYQQVHKYETGLNRMSGGMLWKIACALDIDIDWLFEDVKNPYDGQEVRVTLVGLEDEH